MGIGSLYLYRKIAHMYIEFKYNRVRSRNSMESDENFFVLDCERLAKTEFKDQDFAWRDIMTTAPEQLNIHIQQRLEKAWRPLDSFSSYARLHQQWDRTHRQPQDINENLSETQSGGA